MKKTLLTLMLFLQAIALVKGNNVQTSNVTITGQNTVSQYSIVNFDIAWDNSWRTSDNESNYDGCWIFLKFRKKNTSLWQHATINYVAPGDAASCGHTAASGATLKTAADGKGVWMYRDADGTGDVSFLANSLRWNYGADGVLNSDSVEIAVYAIEMVYVPSGNFYLGSGGAETYRFRDGAVDTYYPVTSENAITVGTSAGNLYAHAGSYIVLGTIPALFPKGYNAFWCMKYEICEQQYIDMINTLSSAQADAMGSSASGTHPNLTANNPERAISGYVNQIMAYMDWSAIRPMTELEYEKACRGKNILPVSGEYAWGNTTISSLGSGTNLGSAFETWGTGNCNYWGYTYNAPIRCGALATSTSTRTSSGGTYYGIMEMSGNHWELTVTVGSVAGLAFTGTHGDGVITGSGHDQANWPSNSGPGIGLRGGGFGYVNGATAADQLAVSGRFYGNYGVAGPGIGGHGVRTAE